MSCHANCTNVLYWSWPKDHQWSGPSVRILVGKSGPVRIGPVQKLDITSKSYHARMHGCASVSLFFSSFLLIAIVCRSSMCVMWKVAHHSLHMQPWKFYRFAWSKALHNFKQNLHSAIVLWKLNQPGYHNYWSSLYSFKASIKLNASLKDPVIGQFVTSNPIPCNY